MLMPDESNIERMRHRILAIYQWGQLPNLSENGLLVYPDVLVLSFEL